MGRPQHRVRNRSSESLPPLGKCARRLAQSASIVGVAGMTSKQDRAGPSRSSSETCLSDFEFSEGQLELLARKRPGRVCEVAPAHTSASITIRSQLMAALPVDTYRHLPGQ